MTKQQRNKYREESANCHISPTRQRLSLLTGESGNMCVCRAMTIELSSKNNPHLLAQITGLICLYLTLRERKRSVEFIYCQVMILFYQVSKARGLYITVNKQVSKPSAQRYHC